MRLLLIEDDTMFGKALVRGLKRNGMTVDWTRNGQDGHAALRRCEHVVALLDIGLPGMTGFEILKAARASRVPPILVITARDRIEDMVTGLDLGADDYIVKPFELRALLARIRAIMRRVSDRSNFLITSKEITLDPSTYVATFRGIESILSAREFAVMYALMERPGTILSRSQIENRIYGWSEEVQSNAVDVVIHGLRKKYGKEIILNIRGAGWMVTKAGS
jgi:DNA-binding response OmpR family regulator